MLRDLLLFEIFIIIIFVKLVLCRAHAIIPDAVAIILRRIDGLELKIRRKRCQSTKITLLDILGANFCGHSTYLPAV